MAIPRHVIATYALFFSSCHDGQCTDECSPPLEETILDGRSFVFGAIGERSTSHQLTIRKNHCTMNTSPASGDGGSPYPATSNACPLQQSRPLWNSWSSLSDWQRLGFPAKSVVFFTPRSKASAAGPPGGSIENNVYPSRNFWVISHVWFSSFVAGGTDVDDRFGGLSLFVVAAFPVYAFSCFLGEFPLVFAGAFSPPKADSRKLDSPSADPPTTSNPSWSACCGSR